MNKFAILLGGHLVRTPRLDAQLAGARTIAADSGMRHAHLLGLSPELWVGDFDSVTRADLERASDVERRVYPPDKDKTDGELAVEEAIARGAKSIILVGAFGGARADHAFLHQATAISLAERGFDVLLSSGEQEARPVAPGETRYDYPPDVLFSILAFSHLEGLSVTGARWPLDDVEVAFGTSLVLSNEVTGQLCIRLGSGRALLLAHLLPPPRKA
jgi:thiamine pyrophosphokinase